MSRRSFRPHERERRAAYHNWICHLCGLPVDPVRERWELEHVVPVAGGGTNDIENTKPAHIACHKPKTAQDVKRIAKGKRVRANHLGSRARPKKPMPGSRWSPFKRVYDREAGCWVTVRRDEI